MYIVTRFCDSIKMSCEGHQLCPVPWWEGASPPHTVCDTRVSYIPCSVNTILTSIEHVSCVCSTGRTRKFKLNFNGFEFFFKMGLAEISNSQQLKKMFSTQQQCFD